MRYKVDVVSLRSREKRDRSIRGRQHITNSFLRGLEDVSWSEGGCLHQLWILNQMMNGQWNYLYNVPYSNTFIPFFFQLLLLLSSLPLLNSFTPETACICFVFVARLTSWPFVTATISVLLVDERFHSRKNFASVPVSLF
jgi:hypothetical protein